MSEPVSVSPGKNPRPMWVLLVLAMTLAPVTVVLSKSLPLGDPLGSLREHVAHSLMPKLFQHLPWPADLWEMGAVTLSGVVTHYLLPVLLMFILLRFSRCGSWLSMNRLALVLLVPAAAGLTLRTFVHVLPRGPDGRFFHWDGFFREWLDGPMQVCLFGGLAVLLLRTLWHRLVLPRPHWIRALAYFWEEK